MSSSCETYSEHFDPHAPRNIARQADDFDSAMAKAGIRFDDIVPPASERHPFIDATRMQSWLM